MPRSLPVVRLLIYTATYQYRGRDRVDITRRGADRGDLAGACLAPSWPIVHALLAARGTPTLYAAWTTYVAAYTEEMRASYRAQPEAWHRLLDHGIQCCNGRLTLCCLCRDETHCHRRLAAVMLAKVGGSNVVYMGA